MRVGAQLLVMAHRPAPALASAFLRPELLLALLLPLGACARTTSTPEPRVLPDLAVTTIDDRPMHLAEAIAHRPALIAVWATWCDACKTEQAALERLDRAAAPRGGLVVAVSVGESSAQVRADLSARPRHFLQLIDEPFALETAAGVHTLPTVFVLDSEGRVVHAGGALDHAALAAFRRVLGVD